MAICHQLVKLWESFLQHPSSPFYTIMGRRPVVLASGEKYPGKVYMIKNRYFKQNLRKHVSISRFTYYNIITIYLALKQLFNSSQINQLLFSHKPKNNYCLVPTCQNVLGEIKFTRRISCYIFFFSSFWFVFFFSFSFFRD